MIAFAVQHQVGTLLVGDPKGITGQDVGRVRNLRLRQWRRTHLLHALQDKAEQAGIIVRLVDERGTSSTCPACRQQGVTAAATSLRLGDGPAWPRATRLTNLRRVGVARCASPSWRLARIKQCCPTGQTLPEGAQDAMNRSRLANASEPWVGPPTRGRSRSSPSGSRAGRRPSSRPAPPPGSANSGPVR